ncbi:hypothetical protein HYZ97_04760 [Candidatus Pacearchaeota archaeon]|nr:hypothetical protein [Candidatus Pacearchaeota archaeon]
MASYDLLGNIAIVKFKPGTIQNKKKRFAQQLLRQNTLVTTVLEKTSRFKGRLRTLKTRWLAGERTTEAVYRENNCTFLFDVDTCYFSPRLASERKEIAQMVRKGESVLVMCGGVAPFAIVIAKNSNVERAASIELGRECSKYALENVKRNKLKDKVEILQGDVRKKVPYLKERFDRIVMARPNLKDDFLDVAFKKIKKEGIIHYYGFYNEELIKNLRELIERRAREAKKKIRIIKIKKAGDIGVRQYRYRADIKVMN